MSEQSSSTNPRDQLVAAQGRLAGAAEDALAAAPDSGANITSPDVVALTDSAFAAKRIIYGYSEIMVSQNRPEIVTISDEMWVEDAIDHPGQLLVRQGFDLEKELHPQMLPGPLIEIGGPTKLGYHIISELGTMPDQIGQINLPEKINQQQGRSVAADGTELPLADECVGAVLMSAIGNADAEENMRVRRAILHDTDRVLATGGLLVIQNFRPVDVEYVHKLGYSIEAEWLQMAVADAFGSSDVVMAAVLRKTPREAEGAEPPAA